MTKYVPPQFIPENFEELRDQECSICFDELFESQMQTPNHIPIQLKSCNHRFHLDCIIDYCGNKKANNDCLCPICNQSIKYSHGKKTYYTDIKNDYETLKYEIENPRIPTPPQPIVEKKPSPPRKKSPEKSHATTSKSNQKSNQKSKSKNNKTKKSSSRSPSRSPPKTPPNKEKIKIENYVIELRKNLKKNYKNMPKNHRNIIDSIKSVYRILNSSEKTKENKIEAYTELKNILESMNKYNKELLGSQIHDYIQQLFLLYDKYDNNEGNIILKIPGEYNQEKQEEINKLYTKMAIMIRVLFDPKATEEKRENMAKLLKKMSIDPNIDERIQEFIKRELKTYYNSKKET